MNEGWIPIELAEIHGNDRVVRSCMMRFRKDVAGVSVSDMVFPDEKFRIVIPKGIRDAIGLRPGSMLMVRTAGDGINIRVLEE